jgi:hypothetical protein
MTSEIKATGETMQRRFMQAQLCRRIAAIVSLVVALGAAPAHAWFGYSKVTSLVVQSNAESVATFAYTTAHSCWSPPDGYHEYLYKIADNPPTATEKLVFATVLSARLASSRVYIVTGGCEYGYERVVLVQVVE